MISTLPNILFPNEINKIIHKRSRVIYILYATIMLYINFYIFDYFHPYPRSNFAPGIYQLESHTGRIFFGFVTTPSSRRRYFPWNNYVKNIIAEGYHQAAFICEYSKDYPQYNFPPNRTFYSIKTNLTINHRDDVDRMARRLTGAQYLLSHPEIDWYWSLTDDVSIDINRINQIISEISKYKNPRKESIILGSCIDKYYSPINKTYLQGGVGYIMSRYAALQFIDYANKWYTSNIDGDDASFRLFIDYLNLSMTDVSIPYFHGADLNCAIQPNHFDNLKKCPKSYKPIDGCGYGTNNFYPIKDFAALHISDLRRNKRVWKRIMKAKVTNVNMYYYFHTDFQISFCKM